MKVIILTIALGVFSLPALASKNSDVDCPHKDDKTLTVASKKVDVEKWFTSSNSTRASKARYSRSRNGAR